MNNLNYKLLLSDLIFIVNVDGKIDVLEYDFIYRIGVCMGMDVEEIDELFINFELFFLFFLEMECIIYFYKLFLVMNVDKVMYEIEVVVLWNFGFKMGICFGVIDIIFVRMEEYEDKIIFV